MLNRILSWLRQTTTVQGLAALACTVVLQVASGLTWPYIAAAAAASFVLLAMPGQGDLSKKIGVLTADAVRVAITKGDPAAVRQLAADGLGMMQGQTPPVDVPAAGPDRSLG